MFTTLIIPEGKKAQLVHSLAQALTLTLTRNHLANKPQRKASTLFGLNPRQHYGLLTSARARDESLKMT